LEADLEQFTKLQKFVDIEWHKVRAPRTWRPKPGEQLIGYYYGKSTRLGHHGQYEVVQMAVPGQGMWLVSGTTILQLVNSACLQTGDPMKVVFLGEKALEGDKKLSCSSSSSARRRRTRRRHRRLAGCVLFALPRAADSV
jgi:hypothetical protein